MTLLGIDLGGTKIAAAVFEDGAIVVRETVELDKGGGGPAGAQVSELVRRFAGDVQAVGICVPGIYRESSGTVWAPNIKGWDDYPLLAEASSAAGPVPVGIDSDRACYILGEHWKGNAQGCSDAIFLAVGTGIGAGVMSGGRVLRGAHDIAGAVGWMALQRPYDSEFEACGCFESQTSGDGIANVAKRYLGTAATYSGPLTSKIDELTAPDIFAALTENDEIAERTIANCIELWGMASANLVSIFDPEKIIFGGGVFGPAVELIPRIKQEAEKWAQPVAMRLVSFEPSALGADAGLYGAGLLAERNIN